MRSILISTYQYLSFSDVAKFSESSFHCIYFHICVCLILYTFIYKYGYMCRASICEAKLKEVGGVMSPMKITPHTRTPWRKVQGRRRVHHLTSVLSAECPLPSKAVHLCDTGKTVRWTAMGQDEEYAVVFPFLPSTEVLLTVQTVSEVRLLLQTLPQPPFSSSEFRFN